ncbi:MAG: SUMF1/EgtB/PvdO family nonheme iron enzyme [Burkholderiaceae bacterium]
MVGARPQLAAPGQWLAAAGGPLELGSRPGEGFVFDNEKWATAVQVAPFSIGAQPVTNGEFAEFVRVGGYRDPRWWAGGSPPPGAGMPRYWRASGGGLNSGASIAGSVG